jgi:hypothetical protein
VICEKPKNLLQYIKQLFFTKTTMRFVPEFITTNFIDKRKKKPSMEAFQDILVANEQKNQALADSIKSAKIALEMTDNVSEIKKGGYEIFKNIVEEINTKLNSIFNFAHSLQSDTDIQTEEKQEWKIVCEQIKQLPSIDRISVNNNNDLKNIRKEYENIIKLVKNTLKNHYKPTNEKHRTLMKVINLCVPLLKRGEQIEKTMQVTGDDLKQMKIFFKKGLHKTKTIERSIGILINIEKTEKWSFKKEFEKRYSTAPKDDKIRAFIFAAQF